MSASPENSHFPLPEALKTLGSLQIERLKKEDDEEQWISGEELCTEGSSDEDDTTLRAKRRGGAKNHRKPHKGGKRLHKLPPKLLEPDGTQEEIKALEPTPQFLAPADISSAETSPTPARKLEEVVDSPLQCSSDACDLFTKKEAEELEISWRPKREECSIQFCQFDVVGKLYDDKLNVSSKDENKGFIEIHEEKGIPNFEIEFNIRENISPDKTLAKTENKDKFEVSKKKPAHFVLRNIKLAASGMGTLAITDKEKQQLERLMHDIDTDCNEKIGNAAQELGFKMDTQSQSTIQQIELQLKSLQADTSVHDIITLHPDETDSLEAKIDSNLEDARIKQRLQEIDKNLALLAVCSTQVIQPLTTEKIKKLLDDCQSTRISSCTLESSDIPINGNTISEHSPCQCMFGPQPSVDEGDTVPTHYFPALSQEVVQQLVEEAKGSMPFFQFKHSL